MMQPQIILLKEGTDTSQGKGQLLSNISACLAVVDVLRSTLGPRGMDKLIHDDKGATISNDGATLMKLLDIVHPAAKTLVDIARAQDAEVGDGTTSVVLLAGQFLKEVRPFVEDGVHPQVIMRAVRRAAAMAIKRIRAIAVKTDGSAEARRDMLVKCAATSLSSKLVAGQKDFFARMVVDAVQRLDDDLPLHMVGVKKVQGGALEDSLLVDGVAFKKTFSYAGFEQQPKKLAAPKVLLLNLELELKSERENAELRIDDPAKYQEFVDAEWNIIYDKLDKCVASGAKVILSKLPIGDLATQYFADRDIFCAGRVDKGDLARVATATGALVQTSVNNVIDDVLGTCELFEERQIGGERFNFFSGCPHSHTATIVLRGGAEQFVEEAERSIHDAIMIVRRAVKHSEVVAGGGAIEMELSAFMRAEARKIAGKEQLIISAIAKALEVIPRQLADNAGLDSTDILNKLRHKHAAAGDAGRWWGVDIVNQGVCDTMETFVCEPSIMKINAIGSAAEAACLVLSIDETVRAPKPHDAQDQQQVGPGAGGMPGMGRGMR